MTLHLGEIAQDDRWEKQRSGRMMALHKARPRSSAHRGAAPVGRALERDLARGFRFDRDAALVTQT